MNVAQLIVDDLRELLGARQSRRDDLVPSVSALRRDAKLAVRSYLGCVVVTASEVGAPVSLTLVDSAVDLATVGTSLRVQLSPSSLADEDPGATAAGTQPARITFYAARPGDLGDLADDFRDALGLDAEQVVLDLPQPPITITAGLSGLDRLVAVHRAVGVLIAQGIPQDAARAHLRTVADPQAEAASILASAT